MSTADEYKAQGNAAFAAKNFEQAAELFGKAIEASPEPNHVLYSNRSGAYASLRDYEKALADAEETIRLKPDWAKGYNRRATAYHGLGDLAKAVDSYDETLKRDPANVQAQKGKKEAEDAIQQSLNGGQNPLDGLSKMFTDPQNLLKLQQNPRTREYMKDPTFMKNLQDISKNPMAALTGQSSDQRIIEALGVMLGVDMKATTAGDDSGDVPMPDAEPSNEPAKPETKAAPTEPKASQSKAAQPESEPAANEKAEADKEKAKGNELYKKREFDAAIEHYEKAWQLHKDITYLNNRSAAEYEKGDYDAAIKTGLTAVEESRELQTDYKAVAKALARVGSSYLKQDKLKEAVEYFDKSLTEQRSPDVLNKLRSTQRELRKREEQAYIDPQKGEEAREEGNALFKEGKFPESVKAYTEAIKRNPAEPRGYANRAASLLKLMNYPDVVRDCDKAIELDPSFFKAYTRKATALNIMKQYRKAMDVLEQARKVDTEHKHTREIEELYYKASTSRFATLPGETEDERAERLSQDPEIDEIRRDPIMNTILQQAAQDPAALQDHMKNPEVRRKINLLAAAGIIRTR